MTTFTPAHRGGAGPPMLCLHGFTDTWRSWELILPALERRHEVLAPTLPGHAGGPRLSEDVSEEAISTEIEQAMDEAGFETAHIVGNSLGGYLALQLAARGRARSVVALAPAGGWAAGDDSWRGTLEFFTTMHELVRQAAPHAELILSSEEGRRRATEYIASSYEHIPRELLVDQMVGAAACEAVGPLVERARERGWRVEPERVTCPLRIVWGTEDRILSWPGAAARYREQWFPNADWVELDGVGHCPQLDVPDETAGLILDFTRSA